MGHKIGYPKKLDRLWDATSLNGTIAADIAELALEEHPSLNNSPPVNPTVADLGRVRESLKHFIRDWSAEGASERETIFSPILNLLATVEPEQRASQKVLVPGSGLCRLAWEISQLGFDTTANEISYFMILAFKYIQSTKQINEHKLRPYAHWWSHQRNNENLFRAVSFPDALPRLGPNFQLVPGDFLSIRPLTPSKPSSEFWKEGSSKPSNEGGYHYIVTLFFIDTSSNVFATMEHIYRLLRPGGSWINLGPLLWSGAKLELSLEELWEAAEEVGFVIQRDHKEEGHPEAPRTIECEYTADRNAMMKFTYKAEFFVARKSK
ncbi:hypothetical protein CC2G_009247 [Coprinopsis cinerea AmutBmut pab1-1]|nr:hypothetical protein CC2G_009247 [Coprinopsis cinerea AmutBmut pab1-1]